MSGYDDMLDSRMHDLYDPDETSKPKVGRTDNGIWYATVNGETFANLAWRWRDAMHFALGAWPDGVTA